MAKSTGRWLWAQGVPIFRAHSETLKTGHARRCRSDAYSDGGSNPPASIRRVRVAHLLMAGPPFAPRYARSYGWQATCQLNEARADGCSP